MTDKEKRKWLTIGVIYAVVFALIMVITNYSRLNEWLGSILRLFRPVLYGLTLAYLVNPAFKFFEQRVFYKIHPKPLRRGISLTSAFLALFAFVALLILLIFPQLSDSISSFAGKYNTYVNSALEQTNKLIDRANAFIAKYSDNPQLFAPLDLTGISDAFTNIFGTNGENIWKGIASYFGKFGGAVKSAFSVLTDWLIGLFIAIYLLASKEYRYAQVIRLRRAMFSDSINEQISRLVYTADHSFGGFIKGKVIDSIIIGFLTYVTIIIFRIPYAALVASFVGVTNVIPVIGPIIGAIPTAFIILLADPGKVIPFVIIIFIIQQLDGNLIGPKILGDNTGVSPLCVLISITTVGSLWGLAGMLLGVPLFATILELTDKYFERKLQGKGIPSGIESFYPPDSLVDPATDAHVTTDTTVQKFERRILNLKERLALHPEQKPTKFEVRMLRFYEFSKKNQLFTEMSDEFLSRFAAEQAANRAREDADALYRSMEGSEPPRTETL